MSWWPFRFDRTETRDTPIAVDDVAIDAPETRDDDLKDEDGVLDALWSGAGAPRATAVAGLGALRVPAVAAAVRVISEAAACLPVRIMERAEDGTEKEDTKHPIGLLLRGDANPWTSGFELIRDLTADALVRDWGGVAYINRVGDEIREVIRYQPSMISVQLEPDTGEPKYRLNGQLVSSDKILHVRGPFDKSPVTLASEAIGTTKEMERHAGNLFRRGARPSGAIQFPAGASISPKIINRLKAAWKAAYEGSDNSGRTAVLYNGATWNPITFKSTDAQFLELRKFQILEICRAFRIPPSMLFEMDRATWSNSEQMGREFLIYCLEPWLRSLETALARALFTREDRKRFRILLDRDDLTRADLTARATAISSLISAKVLNPNEAREWLDLARYDGGDEFQNPHINPATPGPGHNGGPPFEDKEPAAA